MGDASRTELVEMIHPDHPREQAGGSTARATREAFETIYEPAGYVLVEDAVRGELRSLTKAQLQKEAEARGVAVPDDVRTKDQLVDLLAAQEGA